MSGVWCWGRVAGQLVVRYVFGWWLWGHVPLHDAGRLQFGAQYGCAHPAWFWRVFGLRGGVRAHFRGRWLWRDCSWEVFSFLYGDICGGGVGGCDSFSAAVVHVSGGADGEAPPAEGDD